MHITSCPKCGKLYDAVSEEAANEPLWGQNPLARWCKDCYIRAICIHCGKSRGQHVGRELVCFGGHGTVWKPG